MNKKIILILVFFIIAVALFLGYKKFIGTNEVNLDSSLNNLGNTPSKMQSLKDLLALGASQKCTFSSNGSSGTTYISSGKVRGDFSSTVSGKEMLSHMISDGATSYIWTEGEPNGFKMTVDKSKIENNSGDSRNDYDNNSQADLDKKMDFNCMAWRADESMFTPPSNIEFTDYSKMMIDPQSETGSGEGKSPSSTCAYCNALSGDDKAQCLKALNCY